MILLLESAHSDAEALLDDAGPVIRASTVAELDDEQRNEIRAIVTRGKGDVSSSAIAALPNLTVIARCGVGLDNIDTALAATAGVTVVHAPGSTTASVAEHAIMLMLALGRQLCRLDAAVTGGDWGVRAGFQGAELRGKTLGVVGLGAIGSRIGELGMAFDMEVVGTSRREPPPGIEQVPLSELLQRSDVIQVCVELNDETRGSIGVDEFALMKPGALLINTARAQIVDRVALEHALDSSAGGTLAGYASDLWDPEPPLAGDPLISDERVLVTPHTAVLTDVTYREICVRPVESVVAILKGQAPDPSTVFSGS